MTNEQILNAEGISNINKVYNIARQLHDEHRIATELWYAILELKDEHIDEIEIIDKFHPSVSDRILNRKPQTTNQVFDYLEAIDRKVLSEDSLNRLDSGILAIDWNSHYVDTFIQYLEKTKIEKSMISNRLLDMLENENRHRVFEIVKIWTGKSTKQRFCDLYGGRC